MQCPQCQHENPPGAKFCLECGARLALACGQCGVQLPPGAKFCLECGASLAASDKLKAESQTASEPRTPNPLAPSEVGERRQLTVLFCDLVGSTEIAAQLDPEDWHRISKEYQQVAAAAVTRFGGHVDKFLGDGLVCFFGVPEAHDDDAERAVRAGLAIVDAVQTLNKSLLPSPPPLPEMATEEGILIPSSASISASGGGLGWRPILSVRVGMHTGSAVVAHGGGAAQDVFGDTPNIAARVQGAAEPDTVVITAATQRLVAGLFVVEDRGPHALKGIAAPVGLYRVVQASGVRGRLAAAAASGLTPFVGRERERQTVAEAWERAQDGEGQVVLLSGEAGIGKSRLVQEFKASLAQTPHTWIESGGSAYYDTTPFHVVADLLRQGFGFLADLSTEARLDALDRSLAAVGLKPAEAVPVVAPLLDLPLPEGRYPPLFLSPEQQRKRLLATLVAWVCGAARLQPSVIVIEDLHWVDPSTLELLGLMVEQGAREQLLLVLTARPEFRAPWPLRSHHTQLTLNRLTKRQVHEMIVRVAVRVIPPGEMLEALAVRTDGVPLFVEELTRAVLEAEGAALMTREIPVTLQDTLMARLDRLGPAKETAQIASVLGREFSYALLHTVSGLADDPLQAVLAQLTDAELMYVRGLPPEATYTFKHALIQDTAYESLLKSRRRELHRAVAEALTGRFAALAAAQPAVVAQHWETAGDAERATSAWQEAGDRAKERSAMVEAEGHYRRALSVLATQPDTPARASQELALQIALDAVVSVTRGYVSAETEPTRKRVRELSAQTGDTRQLVFSLILAWALPIARGEPRAALVFAEQALAAARNDGSNFALAWAHMAVGQTQFELGDLESAGEHAAEALRFYREEDHRDWPTEPGAVAQAILAWVSAHKGFLERAHGEIEKLLGHGQRLTLASQGCFVHVCAAAAHAYLREITGVTVHANQSLASALENDLPQFTGWSRIFCGWALALQGKREDGIAELREGLVGCAATGTRATAGQYLGWLAEAQLLAGQVIDGLSTIEEALTAVPEQRIHIPELLRLRGELRAAAGADVATVEASFNESVALARDIGTKLIELRATTSLARFLARHGRTDEARARLAPLYAWFTEGFDAPDLQDAKALLEELK
ncbi:MAG: AAA family ATPase [Deltaproteobacteria bacterium]|nr:AAA family ATPase [Deltaproteobacteria bacterium]MBI3390233.1 AAA family ATPase [Deltaproteobacteria bacterium]